MMPLLKFLAWWLLAILVPEGVSAAGSIKLATTTSTENSGLLEHIIPDFEKRYNIDVHVISVGTGRAIKLGENGDVDVILVHDRNAEESFVKAGFGVNRRPVMWNDFVIAGPAEDSAGVKNSKDAVSAFKKIFYNRSFFISRGDISGTHKKERFLWKEAGLNPGARWYIEAGQGMEACLKMADEKRGYILSDRGTYTSYKDKISLSILFEGDKRLFNPYSIIAINPDRFPHARYREAMLFIEWITSADVQKMIEDYRKDREVLFHGMEFQR